MDVERMWIAVAEGDGPDAMPVAICRDPVVIRLALARAREELDKNLVRRRRPLRGPEDRPGDGKPA